MITHQEPDGNRDVQQLDQSLNEELREQLILIFLVGSSILMCGIAIGYLIFSPAARL